MRAVAVAEAKSKLSSLLADVEAGETVAITRHGKIIARLVPESTKTLADVFAPLWADGGLDIEEPADLPAGPVESFD